MNSQSIELNGIWRDLDTVYYEFSCSGELEWLLWDNRVLAIHCSEGIRAEPELLSAAFVYAFAPVGWMFQADIHSPIPVASGAIKTLHRVGRIVCNHYGWPQYDPFSKLSHQQEKSLPRYHKGLLFSGGVDSSTALIALESRLDWLIHLSNFENLDSQTSEAQRQTALNTTQRAAYDRGLGWLHLKTNLASVFKHNLFDHKFPKDCSFWLGLQHSHHIATALTIVRPLLRVNYLAGGFSELLRVAGSCAGTSKYINSYRFPSSLIMVHEFVKRQSKVEVLLDNAPDLLRSLRVCYSSGDGTCGECRKCQATALMILAGGGSLRESSFPHRIVANLVDKVNELKHLPATGNAFYNQALEGRILSGDRTQRWEQLLEILHAER